LTETSVVIVGGPHALSDAEVDLLDRFVRVRGGSLVLVPDQSLSGPVTRLVPGGWRERLERAPLGVGALRASELLMVSARSRWHALESTPDGSAVVASRASGEGRIVVAGAMDAWRWRADNGGGFDRFWRSLVADAADAAGRSLELTMTPRVSMPGENVRIELVHRSMNDARAEARASVEVVCDDERVQIVRLWPSGRGRMAGVFIGGTAGTCRARASWASTDAVEVKETFSDFVVTEQVRRPDDGTGARRLDSLAALYGAPVVRAGDEAELASAVRGRMRPQTLRATVNPMRSPWWIVPFVAALAGEWWLRRRGGLR
jgi:hypothetical protein